MSEDSYDPKEVVTPFNFNAMERFKDSAILNQRKLQNEIAALRTQLERYREALSKIVEVGYGWTGSGSAGKMKLIHLASEALQTKGVE